MGLQEFGGKGGGGVLDPPAALRVARQGGKLAGGAEAVAAGGQVLAFGVGEAWPQSEVERGFLGVDGLDRGGDVATPGLDEGLAEPAWEFLGFQREGIGQGAEDGVDEAGEMGGALAALTGDLDRRVDGAVGGGALCAFDDGEAEGVADCQGRGLAEVLVEELVGGFQVAQRGLGQPQGAGAVGGGEAFPREVGEHPAFAEDAVQDCDCGGARGDAFGH